MYSLAYTIISNYLWPECLINPQIKTLPSLDNNFFNILQCEYFDIDKIKLLVDGLTHISPIHKNKLYTVLTHYQHEHYTDPYKYYLHEVDSLLFFVDTLPLLQINFNTNQRHNSGNGNFYICQVDMAKL